VVPPLSLVKAVVASTLCWHKNPPLPLPRGELILLGWRFLLYNKYCLLPVASCLMVHLCDLCGLCAKKGYKRYRGNREIRVASCMFPVAGCPLPVGKFNNLVSSRLCGLISSWCHHYLAQKQWWHPLFHAAIKTYP
jgi:hypothetical protein